MKTRLKIYKMATFILLKFLTLKSDISRTIWHIELGDDSFFRIFHTLSFERNFFSDQRLPLIRDSTVVFLQYVGGPLMPSFRLFSHYDGSIFGTVRNSIRYNVNNALGNPTSPNRSEVKR